MYHCVYSHVRCVSRGILTAEVTTMKLSNILCLNCKNWDCQLTCSQLTSLLDSNVFPTDFSYESFSELKDREELQGHKATEGRSPPALHRKQG